MLEVSPSIEEKVPSMGAGHKPTTARDVARVVGVSQVTVSHVLNGKGRVSPAMRLRVQEAARELGYEPNPHAQRLVNGGYDDTIGLFSLSLDTGAGTRIIHAIQRLLHERGYSAPIHAYDRMVAFRKPDRASLLADLRRQKPRAIVCHTYGLTSEALDELRRYQNCGGIVIGYDVPCRLEFDQVIFDLGESLVQAARHLMELGHRKIGFCSHVPRRSGTAWLDGFRQTLEEGGAQTHEDWVLFRNNDSAQVGSEGAEAVGAQAAQCLLKLKPAARPTAICVTSDSAAFALIAELSRGGVRVPHDISVTGHDDLALAGYCAPTLTTVTRPHETIAAHLVELLCQRLHNNHGPPRCEVVRGELRRRQSSAPPPR